MAFSILGINHRTAPVSLREKVAFSEEWLLAALRTLREQVGIAEVVILSTCNRTEVYWAGSASGAELSKWLEGHHGNNLDLASSLYVHQEQRAVDACLESRELISRTGRAGQRVPLNQASDPSRPDGIF